MNIKELRELIDGWPDEGQILFKMVSGCCGDYEDLELCDTRFYQNETLTNNYIIIDFTSLPGYKTCRQALGTIQADKDYHK
jgi:hypothetical protein